MADTKQNWDVDVCDENQGLRNEIRQGRINKTQSMKDRIAKLRKDLLILDQYVSKSTGTVNKDKTIPLCKEIHTVMVRLKNDIAKFGEDT